MALPVHNGTLVAALRSTITDIDLQISTIVENHEDPYLQRYTDGKYVLAELLVAKAQCLAAIANLQASGAKR